MQSQGVRYLAALSVLASTAILTPIATASAQAEEVFVRCGNFNEAIANVSVNAAGVQWYGATLSELMAASQDGCRVQPLATRTTVSIDQPSGAVQISPHPGVNRVESAPASSPLTVQISPTPRYTRALW
ncbi:MAG TPA: hypothetical protein V6D19_23665 [Stenomitos sp.]